MRRKVKKWLKSYPSAGRSVKMDFPTIFCFPTWRWEMSRKVKKGLKSYPSGARLVKMVFPSCSLFKPFDIQTFFVFLHGGGR